MIAFINELKIELNNNYKKIISPDYLTNQYYKI